MDKIKVMMDNNNFGLAIESLLELQKNENFLETEEIHYLLTMCYIKTGEFEKALTECKKGLDKAINYYYHLVELQLEILIELNFQEEALVIVSNELAMPYIPIIFEKKYQILYQQIVSSKNKEKPILSIEKIKQILVEDTLEYDIMSRVLEALENYNLRLLIKEIEYCLMNSNQPLIKSGILELLHEQKIDETIKVKVNGLEIECNPLYLELISESLVYSELLLNLKNSLYHQDISLFNIAHHLCFIYLGSQYPLLPEIEEVDMLVEAYTWQAKKMLGYELEEPNNRFVNAVIMQLEQLIGN